MIQVLNHFALVIGWLWLIFMSVVVLLTSFLVLVLNPRQSRKQARSRARGG